MGETSTSRLLISKLLLNNFNLKPNSECPVAKMLVVTKPISTSATTSPTYKKAYSIHTNQAFITTAVIQLIDKTRQVQFSLNMKNKRPRKTIGDAKYYHSTSFEILLHIMREVRHFSRIFLLLFLPVGEQMIQSLQYESQHDQTQKTFSSQTPQWSTASLEKRSCCRGSQSPPFPLFASSGGSPLLRRGESKDWESQLDITNFQIIVCVKLHFYNYHLKKGMTKT